MSSRIPSFSQFKKEIFNRTTQKEKNTLFYWSLFDPSTWEEILRPSYLPNFLKGKEKVLSILEKSDFINKKYINSDKEKFYKSFVQAEFLTNYLLGAQIEERIKGKINGKIDKTNLRRAVFPDVVIKDTNIGIINIEIKSVTSSANLKDRIINEVVNKIKKYKKRYNNFLLLLLFPFCLKDHRSRVYQLIKGYYIYEELIKRYTEDKGKVLCQCFAESGQEPYSLNELSNRVFKYFNNLLK